MDRLTICPLFVAPVQSCRQADTDGPGIKRAVESTDMNSGKNEKSNSQKEAKRRRRSSAREVMGK